MAEQKGGRPISSSMKPTGGDKAIARKKAIFPAQESMPILRRKSRRHQL